ncbi:variable surface protein Vir 12-like [Plasmodium vivax]|uniref:Variable surface protein Vir 12-like n=1 Tax=Plasmodium vivax (strain Salvador I) TaxID=126793 RepID=A5KCT1_PLAVS|nr:variable surface protein Vir 12-like [Plasmodium vivax]EDL42838.1 variable surface protein Vir 12-like [Plasmodium vivax]|eukprot:XP_001608566.1 variable surface protein Vir 12-like [Plasmodium vivax Sal-1]
MSLRKINSQLLGEGLLRDLPANQKYKELNTDEDVEYNTDICKKHGLYWGDAQDFCDRAVSNLKKVNSISNKQRHNEECSYFQHWFYDEIRKNYKKKGWYINNTDNSNNLFDVINEFNLVDKVNTNKCNLYSNRSVEDVIEEKALHDYFKNFDRIGCDGLSEETCQMYYNYVQYINDLYKKYDNKYLCCYTTDDVVEDACKRFFKCGKRYNPQNLLVKLGGHIQQLQSQRIGNVDYGSQDNLNTYDSSEAGYLSPHNYQYNYDMEPEYDSTVKSHKFRNVSIITGMIGIFLGLLFYIRSNSAKHKRRRRRESNVDDNMSNFSETDSNVSSRDDLDSIFSDFPKKRLYLAYHA